jgi:hypothetical protein
VRTLAPPAALTASATAAALGGPSHPVPVDQRVSGRGIGPRADPERRTCKCKARDYRTVYSASMTCSPQSVSGRSCPSERPSHVARWVVKWSVSAPCQRHWPVGGQTVSPGRMTTISPPRTWVRPTPSVTCKCLTVGVPVSRGAGAGGEVHGVDPAMRGLGARGDLVEPDVAVNHSAGSLDRRLLGQISTFFSGLFGTYSPVDGRDDGDGGVLPPEPMVGDAQRVGPPAVLRSEPLGADRTLIIFLTQTHWLEAFPLTAPPVASLSAVDPHTVERACPAVTRWSALPEDLVQQGQVCSACLGRWWAGWHSSTTHSPEPTALPFHPKAGVPALDSHLPTSTPFLPCARTGTMTRRGGSRLDGVTQSKERRRRAARPPLSTGSDARPTADPPPSPPTAAGAKAGRLPWRLVLAAGQHRQCDFSWRRSPADAWRGRGSGRVGFAPAAEDKPDSPPLRGLGEELAAQSQATVDLFRRRETNVPTIAPMTASRTRHGMQVAVPGGVVSRSGESWGSARIRR